MTVLGVRLLQAYDFSHAPIFDFENQVWSASTIPTPSPLKTKPHRIRFLAKIRRIRSRELWEDVLLKAEKHRNKVRSGFFFQNSTYKLTMYSASNAVD